MCIRDRLYLARRDAQRSDLRKPVDLTFLLADIVDSLEPLAAQKGIALTLRTPARLMIQGDSDSLARLFVNLLDNAIKYTQQGGVSVSAAAHTDGATVTVSDSGVGICLLYTSRCV